MSLTDPTILIPLASLAWFVVGFFCGRQFPASATSRRSSRTRGNRRKSGGGGRPASSGGGRGDQEIYVGNLPYSLTEKDVRGLFATYGTVDAVRMITNKYNNKSKGYAFVQMNDAGQREKAIKALNGKDCEGRKMVVNMAKNKGR